MARKNIIRIYVKEVDKFLNNHECFTDFESVGVFNVLEDLKADLYREFAADTKKNLMKIADKGELEDLRVALEDYFPTN
jgi:hypothetical protein